VASTSNSLSLPYRRPFDWQKLLAFFAARATPAVESVADGVYRRTLHCSAGPVIIEIGNDTKAGALVLRRLDGRRPPPDDVAAATRRVFDVDAPVRRIRRALRSDPALARLLAGQPGVRVPGAWDGFELTVRAVLGQQISVRAATTLAGRIAARYGERLAMRGDPERADRPDRLFPTPARLARARLNGLGIVGSRIKTIRAVAAAVRSGELRLDGSGDPADVRAALLAIPGIGDWTAGYVAMRALRDADAYPTADLGLRIALAPPARATPAELAASAEGWRPWRAYAAMLLWGSLEGSGG